MHVLFQQNSGYNLLQYRVMTFKTGFNDPHEKKIAGKSVNRPNGQNSKKFQNFLKENGISIY
jgi:hypothetical protein